MNESDAKKDAIIVLQFKELNLTVSKGHLVMLVEKFLSQNSYVGREKYFRTIVWLLSELASA